MDIEKKGRFNVSGPEYNYLGKFRGKALEEGCLHEKLDLGLDPMEYDYYEEDHEDKDEDDYGK